MVLKRFIDQMPLTLTDDGTLVVVNPDGTPIASGGAGGVSGPVDVTDRAARLVGHVSVDGTALVDLVDATGRLLGHVTVDNWPSSQPVSGPLTDAQLRAAAFPVTANQGTPAAAPWPVQDKQYNQLEVSATGAAGAAVTAALPAVAGQFHYIEHIEITAYSTAARTGSATPIVVSTTNLGGLAWTFATAAAIGATDKELVQPSHPIRSAAAGVATTIVCPAATSVIWRVNVTYWTGA